MYRNWLGIMCVKVFSLKIPPFLCPKKYKIIRIYCKLFSIFIYVRIWKITWRLLWQKIYRSKNKLKTSILFYNWKNLVFLGLFCWRTKWLSRVTSGNRRSNLGHVVWNNRYFIWDAFSSCWPTRGHIGRSTRISNPV